MHVEHLCTDRGVQFMTPSQCVWFMEIVMKAGYDESTFLQIMHINETYTRWRSKMKRNWENCTHRFSIVSKLEKSQSIKGKLFYLMTWKFKDKFLNANIKWKEEKYVYVS